ncbi:AAA family ATPase [Rhodococcus sp. IEGM 1330]|uniref:AAA family ATPase n=1 Tax=Rhodococcus sp. IEGM 1330 TaxID=3082225 RepID=UPI002954D46D|nr:AAA family ATPase [Rhodococcus sp. IEGM 1330]MDV8023741.1 AAA family ATPase [Rhodococcus sp. IEGM 1330]
MIDRDQLPVVVVAGAAGSGKTTLGRELARRFGTALLDLDTLTNPLLDQLDSLLDGPHWNSAGPHSELIRAGRYAVLLAAARDLVEIGQRPFLVAPFTRELTAGTEWERLVSHVTPAATMVVHVDGSPELLARRRAARGAARDAHRPVDAPAVKPLVPHLRVDAELSTEQQVDLVVHALKDQSQR